MLLIRSALFNVVFYATFIAFMVIGVPFLLISRGSALLVVRLWARVSVWLLAVMCGTRIEFRNLELLPKGASIVAVKHQSFLETFALINVLDDFTYILKKELTTIPFFGWYLRATQQIGIDRSKKGSTMGMLVRAVQEKLAAGRQIVIFPEGTRCPVGMPAVYKPGVSVLCVAGNVPCTPVALNSGLFWPRHSFVRRPGTVVIEFLPPIHPGLDKRHFMAALENAIEPATNALVARALADNPDLDDSIVRRTPAAA
jgi:1-acyl-sn-glycerol-3-phosphate acyltransferase